MIPGNTRCRVQALKVRVACGPTPSTPMVTFGVVLCSCRVFRNAGGDLGGCPRGGCPNANETNCLSVSGMGLAFACPYFPRLSLSATA